MSKKSKSSPKRNATRKAGRSQGGATTTRMPLPPPFYVMFYGANTRKPEYVIHYATAEDKAALVTALNSDDPAVLHGLSSYDHREVRRAVAGNPATSKETLARFVTEETDVDILADVAAHNGANPGDLDALARHHNVDVRWELANNPVVTPEALVILAADPAVDVARTVACSSHYTDAVGEVLASHPSAYIRDIAAARNPATSEDELNSLVTIGDIHLMSAAAGNPSLTFSQQLRIAHYRSPIAGQISQVVQLRLMRNPCLHPRIRLMLSKA